MRRYMKRGRTTIKYMAGDEQWLVITLTLTFVDE